MTLFRFTNGRQWWDGMNYRTRLDLIKRFGFKARDDFGYDNLSTWERRLVDDRFANYKRVCDRLDHEREAPLADRPDMPEGMIDHDEEDRRAYQEEKNVRHRPSEY